MYEHILEKERQVYWIYGNVTCAGYPLTHIDTISPTGEINTDSALNIIVYGVGYYFSCQSFMYICVCVYIK